ncbi:hypothetical protein [Vibrio crassostreae]|uniref:hypothetical protein n=1 Tax=Vibrio crassostreae TaxID=246167 RepID=UPI001B312CD8|nr:hypothetical protein [Vibrio crassostreae]
MSRLTKIIGITTDHQHKNVADTVLTRMKVVDAGSCSFCDRGEITRSGNNLIYPYTHVTKIDGVGIRVQACDTCLGVISEFSKVLKEDPTAKKSVYKSEMD